MTPLKWQTPKTPFGTSTKILELYPIQIECIKYPMRRLGGLNVTFGDSGSPLLLIQPPYLISYRKRSTTIDGVFLYQ